MEIGKPTQRHECNVGNVCIIKIHHVTASISRCPSSTWSYENRRRTSGMLPKRIPVFRGRLATGESVTKSKYKNHQSIRLWYETGLTRHTLLPFHQLLGWWLFRGGVVEYGATEYNNTKFNPNWSASILGTVHILVGYCSLAGECLLLSNSLRGTWGFEWSLIPFTLPPPPETIAHA